MKAKHFLTVILFISLNSFGQSYLKMTNDSIFWDIHYAEMDYWICQKYGGGGLRFCFGNDTIINGLYYTNIKSYQIISDYYPVKCPPFHVDTISLNTNSYIREDTIGKIYVYNNYSHSEYLLFDYNVQIGDSIYYDNFGYFHIDTIVNIITSDGISRRKYLYNVVDYFIEGIGGVAGPIYPPFHYFENGPWLECWWYLNSNLHHCSDFLSNMTSNKIENKNLSIYPNPFMDIINISDISHIKSIKITNIIGMVVYNSKQINSAQINTVDFENGIYFIELKLDNDEIIKNKIIKNSL